MKTNYQFVANLFHKAEQIEQQVNNLQVNGFKIRRGINGISIEAVCINEFGTIYGTNDIRIIEPTYKQLGRLNKIEDNFVFED